MRSKDDDLSGLYYDGMMACSKYQPPQYVLRYVILLAAPLPCETNQAQRQASIKGFTVQKSHWGYRMRHSGGIRFNMDIVVFCS